MLWCGVPISCPGWQLWCTGWQHSLEEWKVCSEKQSDVHELGVCRVTMGFERWILGAQVGDQQLSGAETQEQRLPPMKAAKVCE